MIVIIFKSIILITAATVISHFLCHKPRYATVYNFIYSDAEIMVDTKPLFSNNQHLSYK